MRTIPALGLIRVSTSRQMKNGYSPEEQQAAIARFAEINKLKIIEYVVEQKTGFTTDRADVRRMRELAAQKRIRAVVVFVMDRLSRGLEVQLAIKREINELGLALYTTTRGLIEDTPEANLLSNVEGAFSQHEIETFVRRSKMGKLGKAKSGKWIGSGHAPYGYRKQGLKGDSRLVKVPGEIKIVHRIFDEYTQKRLGTRAIAEGLNRDQVPAPYGGLWWWSTIKRLLSLRVYVGEIEYCGILIPLPDLAVIERAQFDEAQRLKARNKERAKRNRKHEYALSNRLCCACGRKMIGDGGVCYRCVSLNLPIDERLCTYGRVYQTSIEPVVWEYLRSLLTPDRLAAAVKQMEKQQARQRPPASRVDQIDREIERLKRRIAALMDEFGDDETLAAIAGDKMRALSEEIQQLEAERAEAQSKHRDADATAKARDMVAQNVDKIRAMLDAPDSAVREMVLEALDVAVELRSRPNGGRGVVVETIFGRSRLLPIKHNPGRGAVRL